MKQEREFKRLMKRVEEIYQRTPPICGDRFFRCTGEGCSPNVMLNVELCSTMAKLNKLDAELTKKFREGGFKVMGDSKAMVAKDSQWLSPEVLDELKERLDIHGKFVDVIPESLKYYGVQYIENGKVQNKSCFDKEEAEKLCEALSKRKMQYKMVEGIRAAGVNMLVRTLGCEEVPELAHSTNNFDAIAARLSEGKGGVIYVTERRAVRGKDGKVIFGSASSAVAISGQNLGLLDKLFHSTLAKTETRAQARAEAKWLGIPMVIAEDLEAAEGGTENTKVIIDAPAQATAKEPEVTPPDARNAKIQELLRKISSESATKQKVIAELKKKLRVSGSFKEVKEEIYQRLVAELEKKAEKVDI